MREDIEELLAAHKKAATKLGEFLKLEAREEAALQSVLDRIETLRSAHEINPCKDTFDQLVKAQDKLRYMREDLSNERSDRVHVEELRAELRRLEILIEAYFDYCSQRVLEGTAHEMV